MGKMKDCLYEESDEMMPEEKAGPEEREYPVKQRIGGYPVRHYYEQENPVWEIFDDEGNLLGVAHSHEELHSITEAASDENGGI